MKKNTPPEFGLFAWREDNRYAWSERVGHKSFKSQKLADKAAQRMYDQGKPVVVRSRELMRETRSGGGPGYSVPAERNPRENPTLLTFSENPSKSGRAALLSKRAYEVRYKHAEDGKAYKHSFGAGVNIELLRDGSVRLFHSKGKSLWGDF